MLSPEADRKNGANPMNANQLTNMIVRMFVRKLMNFGMNAGIEAMSRRGRSADGDTAQDSAPAPGFDAKRAKQSARMVRRMGRF